MLFAVRYPQPGQGVWYALVRGWQVQDGQWDTYPPADTVQVLCVKCSSAYRRDISPCNHR